MNRNAKSWKNVKTKRTMKRKWDDMRALRGMEMKMQRK